MSTDIDTLAAVVALTPAQRQLAAASETGEVAS